MDERYLNTVLEQGGSKPGRDEGFSVFSKWLTEEFEGEAVAAAAG